MTVNNIIKSTEITFAGVASAGIALGFGMCVSLSCLYDGNPIDAVGILFFTTYHQEKKVICATVEEYKKADYSIQKIFEAAYS